MSKKPASTITEPVIPVEEELLSVVVKVLPDVKRPVTGKRPPGFEIEVDLE